jgi:hypothetical protein
LKDACSVECEFLLEEREEVGQGFLLDGTHDRFVVFVQRDNPIVARLEGVHRRHQSIHAGRGVGLNGGEECEFELYTFNFGSQKQFTNPEKVH